MPKILKKAQSEVHEGIDHDAESCRHMARR
jgi:hypothetical protein